MNCLIDYIKLYDEPILIAKISLKYNDDSIFLIEISREMYAKILEEKKNKRDYMDYYFKRISASEYNKISRKIYRDNAKKEYNKAIQAKYNVGENWQQNRWFVEQVRPCL